MPRVLLDFSIFPIDQGESLSSHVAGALDIIDRSGLDYRLGPMGTTLEGEYDQCIAVVNDCFAAMSAECGRVLLQLKVDYRRGRESGALQTKTASIEAKLERKLCT